MEWIGYIGIGILVLLVLLVLVTNIQIVQQSRAYVVERLGAYSATWGVGLHFKIPFFERVVKKVSLKEQVADFDPQPVITKDNVTMQIDTVIYFQITDPKLYTYGVEHPMNAIENLTATTLRNIIGEMELDQSLTSRDVINAKMRSILDEATDPWGIKVNRVELKNILPPREIQNAMEKQMKAERERRESILQAEGQKQSQILVAEGEKQSTILRADAEKQAAILRAEAEKEKMRGNLLRAVSHDIRTPLTSIVGGVSTLLDSGDQLDEATRTQLLENIRDESNWLVSVVENLLSVTRMSGASNIKKELEAGEEVLGAASMKFQRHYPATRVEISAPDTLLMIPMDIILIEQVLINLMENAVQHGKTTTQISLRLTRSEDLAVFEVSDDGQGIAPALLPHLFDGYLTRDQEAISDKRRNMGIGLSVCKSIVQAHGGAMRASNRPTGGALLQFTLPLEETSHEDQRKSTPD